MTVTTGAPPQSATAKQRAALERARRLTALQVDTLTRAVVDIDDTVGWARLTELGTRSVTVAQESATAATTDLLNATLNAADLVGDISSLPGIQPGRLASGNDVRGMFAMTRDVVSHRMTGGATFAEGLNASANKLVAIAASEPHRIGRDGQINQGLVDERFNRYRRVAVGATCKFCLMLATRGAVYLTAASAGQARKYHAHCVPADTLVRSPGTEAATRRSYEGELVVITTASGKHLRITPNHPVLTDRGWVAAGSLDHGDYVVDGSGLDWRRLNVPDVDDAPALIGDVFQSMSVMGRTSRMEGTPEDFYGDGRHGQVDVVRPNGLFDDALVAAFAEHGAEHGLALGLGLGGIPLAGLGLLHQALGADLDSAHGVVSSLGLAQSVLGAHGGSASPTSAGASAHWDASVVEFEQERRALHAVATGDSQRGFSIDVLLDGFVGNVESPRAAAGDRAPNRFDPATTKMGVERGLVYSERGGQLLDRLAGQVTLDRIVNLRRVDWSGHVFDLHTVEGWYSGDGIIVSNCDCAVELVADAAVIKQSKGLSGDWRNAINDPARMREAGALRGWSGVPDDFVRQQASREAAAELAARQAFDAANPTGVTSDAADMLASGGWAPGNWVAVDPVDLIPALPPHLAEAAAAREKLNDLLSYTGSARNRKARPVVHAMRNGNKTIMSTQKFTGAQLRDLLSDFDEAIAAIPGDLRSNPVTLDIPVGDSHWKGRTGGYVIAGSPRIHLKPAIATGAERWPESEFHMPAAAQNRTRRDVIMHEMGHIVDGMRNTTGVLRASAPKYSEDAFWARLMSQMPAGAYSQKNVHEGFAEMFMQYHVGGPGSHPIADAYAARYAW